MTDRDEGRLSLPLVAIRALTPTTREKQRISLFKLDDEAAAPRLAAAYWLTQREQFAMIAVDSQVLVDTGAVLDEKVRGETYHIDVNELHVDLKVETGDDAITYARAFFEHGELLPVESRELRISIANDNAAGLVDFQRLATVKNTQSVTHLCDLISASTLVLSTP